MYETDELLCSYRRIRTLSQLILRQAGAMAFINYVKNEDHSCSQAYKFHSANKRHQQETQAFEELAKMFHAFFSPPPGAALPAITNEQ
jgi:hypothetical protein